MAQLMLPGNALPADVLLTKTFSAGANYGAVGTMPDRGALTYTPTTTDVSIADGKHTGSKVAAVVVPAAKVLSDTTIAGTTGTMKNRPALTGAGGVGRHLALGYNSGTTGRLLSQVPDGFFDGGGNSWVYLDDANFIPANILAGKTIFGVVGTLPLGKLYAEGTVTTNASGTATVTGLTFQPATIVTYVSESSIAEWIGVYATVLGLTINRAYRNTDQPGVANVTKGSFVINAGGFVYSTSTSVPSKSLSWIAYGS